jgi:transcriptional regulator with XRE-family HTH domain
MQIEDAFRKARERAGLSQGMLAIELGCTQQSISKWEGGYAKPEADKVEEMDGLLGFSEAERRAISNGYPRVFEDIPAGFRKKWSGLSAAQRKKVTSYLDKVAAGKA